MEAVYIAIVDWAVARWGKTKVHRYRLKERMGCPKDETCYIPEQEGCPISFEDW